ncbi:hypothetical protein ACPXCP_08965 [Streptomyces sp. DT20]|uniref:hypothetical protein n=1 Tax=unclassified Streptomyces TaxID=2593676 RepID=UPI002E2BA70D|nr:MULTISPECIES: hypothetical protein [unclassified Streptomyces]
MNRLSGRTVRVRGARVPVLLGWLLVLLSVASCCSFNSAGPTADPHHGTVPLSAFHSFTRAAVADEARVVVADAPRNRGSSCHVAPDDATPVVLTAPPAPAALPCAPAVLPAGSLTGAAGIRGPSNDAVGDVDHLRLQVQRI